MTNRLTAASFLADLAQLKSDVELDKYQRYFQFNKEDQSPVDYFIGVKMGDVFKLAKAYVAMPTLEIEKVLESPIHEARVGAVSIMDWRVRGKKTTEKQKKALFDLYLRRHDRINNWDIVDRAAPRVIGSYLFDKPRGILYELAQSSNIWERRNAIVSTGFFIKQGEVEDTFEIAKILLNDSEDLIHKAVGWMLRVAGDMEPKLQLAFLSEYAHDMPRVMLRYASEHLSKAQKEKLRKL